MGTNVYPESMNEDGSVNDVGAQKLLEEQQLRSDTSPNDRATPDGSAGNPQWLEDHSPEYMHSDGGPTLHAEPGTYEPEAVGPGTEENEENRPNVASTPAKAPSPTDPGKESKSGKPPVERAP